MIGEYYTLGHMTYCSQVPDNITTTKKSPVQNERGLDGLFGSQITFLVVLPR